MSSNRGDDDQSSSMARAAADNHDGCWLEERASECASFVSLSLSGRPTSFHDPAEPLTLCGIPPLFLHSKDFFCRFRSVASCDRGSIQLNLNRLLN